MLFEGMPDREWKEGEKRVSACLRCCWGACLQMQSSWQLRIVGSGWSSGRKGREAGQVEKLGVEQGLISGEGWNVARPATCF